MAKNMTLDNAIRKRIEELVEEKDTSLTNLCLMSDLTPSTVFDFMYGKSKFPNIITIKKLCLGAEISLKEFFDRDYFDGDNGIY